MISLLGDKIVTASEMARVESLAYDAGFKEQDFMEAAGNGAAKEIEAFIKERKTGKKIYFLIGKGNNGGDGFVAALALLKKDYDITIFHLAEMKDCSPLCQKYGKAYLKKQKIISVQSVQDIRFGKTGIIVDALLGTGFKGSLEGLLLQTVEKANQTPLPRVSIDIPSGVNGITGEVQTSAIKASLTIYLGLPKLGFFLRQGFEHLGKIKKVYFGLEQSFTEQAEEFGILLNEPAIADHFPKIHRVRHKYQAGYVVGIAGSKGMGGAAKLSSLSALRAGSGIVKLFYPKEMDFEMEVSPLELVRNNWSLDSIGELVKVCNKAKSVFIGPGIGREKETETFLERLIPQLTAPVVLDADGLFFFANHSDISLPENVVFTPHHQEMLRLLHKEQVEHEEKLLSLCQNYVEQHQLTVVLKGPPTWVFHPGIKPLAIVQGDPGLATAGTGDVLTGVIASLISQGLDCYEGSVLGVYLHARAGEEAAKEKTSYSMIASDVIESLPAAIRSIMIK